MSSSTFIDANEVQRTAPPPGHVYLVKIIRGGKVFMGFAGALEERENTMVLRDRHIPRTTQDGRIEALALPEQSYRKSNCAYFAYAVPRPAWWPVPPATGAA